VLCLVFKVNGTMDGDSFTGEAYAVIVWAGGCLSCHFEKDE